MLAGLTAAALALGACGFTPAYGPQGAATRLEGRVGLSEPKTPNDYLFTRRFEERLGRTAAPQMLLNVRLSTSQEGLGSTSAGSTTRYRINGTATYTLVNMATATEVLTGKTHGFTGYSTTGSTVATLAAERDAAERLMILLADQVIDNLLLSADILPQ